MPTASEDSSTTPDEIAPIESSPSTNSDPPKPSIGPSATAGAGTGTLIAGLGKLLLKGDWESLAVLAAPSAAAGVTFFGKKLGGICQGAWEDVNETIYYKWMRRTLNKHLNESGISESETRKTKKDIDELDMLFRGRKMHKSRTRLRPK